MEKKAMIWLASKCAEKGWDFETLKYGDDLYGKECLAEEVWEYVEEYKDFGRLVFAKMYIDYLLY